MFKKLLKISLVAVVLILLIAGYAGLKIFGVNTSHTEAKELYISSGSSLDEVVSQLKTSDILDDDESFRWVSGLMNYEDRVKPGKYQIPPSLSNRELVGLLRSGRQEPINITISTARMISEVAGDAADRIESDSIAVLGSLLNEAFLEKVGMNEATVIGMIIPNTYQAYWSMTADQFADRMHEEYKKFWAAKDREAKRAALGLTKQEVSTLASIVEKESIQADERPIIAGLYMNRVMRDIPLQADPTVVFGVGDFTIRRVLNKHLAHESPYNTYLNAGLPPGPICMPSIASIDAVLNYDKHDYLYMCAKPGYNGSHSFAKSLSEHERNANVYRRWLSSEGIRG